MHSFITAAFPEVSTGLDLLVITPETSIGIEEVRSIQSFLSRKPVTSDHNTVVVNSAHLLTLPAQHAFLKTLEEPPVGTLIYLVTDKSDLLLPTILSRCQLIETQAISPNDPAAVTSADDFFRKLLTSKSVGERLILVDSQNFTRESALKFLDLIETVIHNQLGSQLSTLNCQLPTIYTHFVLARKYLKSNVSVRLSMDNLAINCIS